MHDLSNTIYSMFLHVISIVIKGRVKEIVEEGPRRESLLKALGNLSEVKEPSFQLKFVYSCI